jgi:hypothetical protein
VIVRRQRRREKPTFALAADADPTDEVSPSPFLTLTGHSRITGLAGAAERAALPPLIGMFGQTGTLGDLIHSLGLVGLSPATASAGYYHGHGWGGPGFGVYVGPRHRYGRYAYRHRPYYYDRYSYGYGPRWRYRHRDWD